MSENLHDRLVAAILDTDRTLANQLIDDWASSNGYLQAMIEVVSPALNEIGLMYAEKKEFSLAQAYVAAKIAEDTLEKIPPNQTISSQKAINAPVVIGNIEDDYHPLGRKMVATFLRAASWQVYDLGIDVTAEEFVDKAVDVKAHVVGASAMLYTTAMNIKKLREEIDQRGLSRQLQLAVGGAVFNLRPELVEEVGGDGSADSAVDAPALFEKLWNASLEERGA